MPLQGPLSLRPSKCYPNGLQMAPKMLPRCFPDASHDVNLVIFEKSLRTGLPGGQNVPTPCTSLLRLLNRPQRPYRAKLDFWPIIYLNNYLPYSALFGVCAGVIIDMYACV